MNSILKSIAFVLLVSCSLSGAYAQKVRQVPIEKYVSKAQYQTVSLNRYVDLTDYLPTGYVFDGSIDYTKFLQKGINENQFILMPDFPILVNDKGLIVNSNKSIFFNVQSAIILKGSNKDRYHIFDLKNSDNVKIYNPRLVGDRDAHIGEKGEWGMGINLYSSSNIQIYNPEISKCWGDGIYIGGDSDKPSRDVLIEGGSIDYSRRNGISITNGENIVIKNIVIANTVGTAPMCGVDLEPNNTLNKLKNISLESINTVNNADVGIAINLSKLGEVNNDNFELLINKHNDLGSKIGIGVGGLSNNKLQGQRGLIKIVNSNFESNRPFEVWSKESDAIQIEVFNPVVESAKLNTLKKKLKSNRVDIIWKNR